MQTDVPWWAYVIFAVVMVIGVGAYLLRRVRPDVPRNWWKG